MMPEIGAFLSEEDHLRQVGTLLKNHLRYVPTGRSPKTGDRSPIGISAMKCTYKKIDLILFQIRDSDLCLKIWCLIGTMLNNQPLPCVNIQWTKP